MSRNPILNDKAFGFEGTGRSPAQEWAAAQRDGVGTFAAGAADGIWDRAQQQPLGAQPYGQPYPPATDGPIIGARTHTRTMTLGGVSAAGLTMFVFLILGAFYGWSQVTLVPLRQALDGSTVYSADMSRPFVLFGALIGAFILAMVTAFVPKAARFTAVPYALLEGVVLGMISHLYEAQSSGIVLQAILATFAVFAVMLLLYGLRILRATPKFVKGVIAATFGILLMYAAGWILSLLFHGFSPFWTSSGAFGTVISVIIVVVAALNLILDFDFIERGSQNQLPAYMDWYAAFGLMVTLIWLYLEILRLLARMRD